MKNFGILVGIILFASFGEAKEWNLKDVIQNADPKETRDLVNILGDIEFAPMKDPATGKTCSKVKKIKTGSIYDKAGIKVGDTIASSNH
jgi:hypothetical protein